MAMTGGYPAEADIDTYLSARGLELVTLGNANYYAEQKQFVWGLVNMLDWAGALAVYAASATTFNVRGGQYVWKGTVKTYSPGSAVDPTDNDTTYVWLEGDNTIGYGVDGNGWPDCEHIKLGEITVDSDGDITAVTDRRGRAFMRLPQAEAEDLVFCDNEIIAYENEAIYI